MKKAFFFTCLFLAGCFSSKFNFEKVSNPSKKLRLDGCYYLWSTGNYRSSVSIYFLYSNGVFLGGGTSFESLEKGLKSYEDGFKINRKIYPIERSDWGLYKIINDTIIMEQPEPSEGYPLHKTTGIILNDTTFKNLYYEERKIVTKIKGEVIFHFKQLNHKPDSTNSFIK